MTTRIISLTTVLLALLLTFTHSIANHEKKELTDGTVKSFRWLKQPMTLGNFSIHDEKGKQVALSEFKNKIVLLNIWASWCSPCVRELPALDRLQQRLGGEDFVVLAVSVDTDPNLARKIFNDKLSIQHMDLYLEPAQQLGKFFPVDVLPSNFFINRNGQALGMLRSFINWDDPAAAKLIKRLIDGVSSNTLRMERTNHIIR